MVEVAVELLIELPEDAEDGNASSFCRSISGTTCGSFSVESLLKDTCPVYLGIAVDECLGTVELLPDHLLDAGAIVLWHDGTFRKMQRGRLI